MPFWETPFEGLVVFMPQVWEDHRGYFFESYNRSTFSEAGIDTDFVQDNQARSSYGVLRGLHFQRPPFEQAKLVRVTEGAVYDIAVDMRKGAPTYGQWYGVELSAENKRQLFIPRGFAHGYVVLTPSAEFCYKCDNFYSKAHEDGIRFDDPTLQIDWQINPGDVILSSKDLELPWFGK